MVAYFGKIPVNPASRLTSTGLRSQARRPRYIPKAHKRSDFCMRLESQEIQTMATALEAIIGNGSEIWVFGSRLDDSNRGGDLDLLIESDAPVDALSRANLNGVWKINSPCLWHHFSAKRKKTKRFSRTRVFKKRNLTMTPDPVILSSET